MMNDDTISKKAAIDALFEMYCKSDEDGYVWIIRGDACKKIDALPSAQPERKKGRWERHNTYHGDDTSGYVDPDWRCSKCGKRANINEYFMYDLTDFCPNCGADMRGEEDE